ncbi:MAG: DUF853 family protein [Gemmataceae bacterium]|nr:DUF853 family protein [Gemmataceae bacterium]
MAAALPDYEKLGVFYLGRKYDLPAKKTLDDLVLFPSKNLVTHGLVVGMTGSGKTGLCFDLIEEAAIDGIPAIVIDPKGDLSNLLLTFPGLTPEQFRPWVNEEDAVKAGVSVDEFAAQQAAMWKKGLADWKQEPDRIDRLRAAADFSVFTPGSSAGLPVSVLRSFDVPPPEILEDGELLRERVSSTVGGLLQLVGVSADSVKSREMVFLSNILQKAWADGRSLDLGGLIAEVQNPTVKKVGVLDVDTFFPAKDRFELAMQLNNLLASPSFAAWMEGEPLDIGKMLYSPAGKPQVAIFSIAHLGDAERMFFVTMLLNQMLAWMRSQSGTSSLRALLYMDEIFGYFPPVANPPSKQPLLTLLKQARAFGLGVVLATQNPVDIDYKGLSNIGTWFIGRLQTERDKMRILDGLDGAASAQGGKFDRGEMERTLSALGNRVFLLHSVHDDGQVIMQSRWAMSYLRGPMSRAQIKGLMAARRAEAVPPKPAGSENKPAIAAKPAAAARPVLPPEITQLFAPPRAGDGIVFLPRLFACAQVRFADKKLKVDDGQDISAVVEITDDAVPVNWDQAEEIEIPLDDLSKDAPHGEFAECAGPASTSKNYAKWSKDFANWVYANKRLTLFQFSNDDIDLTSKVGEEEREFRIRVQQAMRETRDAAVAKLQTKFAKEFAKQEEKVRKAELALQAKEAQAQSSKMSTVISFGSTILGSIFGGRKVVTAGNISKAATAAKSVGRTMQQSQNAENAQQNVDAEKQKLQELHDTMQAEIDAISESADAAKLQLETAEIKPTKANISVRLVGLVWLPFVRGDKGTLDRAY